MALALRDEAARAFQEASRKAGRPWMSFTTDDCQRDYEALQAKGVGSHAPER